MKILITPIGIYIGRVMKGISTIKPDKIYLCTQKPTERKLNKYHKALYKKWVSTTKKYAKKIKKKLGVVYGPDDVQALPIDIDDYLSIFKDLLRLILSFEPDTEVYIDTTSTTYPFRVAAITLSIFHKNVRFMYTPASRPRVPEDYKEEVRKDKGMETGIIPSPNIDFSELQTGILRDTLVTLNTCFDGEAPSVTDLLLELGMEDNKGNMIKMSKLLKKLKRYGCVKTEKEGRAKKVSLTMIGDAISDVLKEV